MQNKAKVTRIVWDAPFPVYSQFTWISEGPIWMQNRNPVVFFGDGTSRKVKAEDLAEILAEDG